MRAATPPTIYVRRGSKVTLRVINPSPLETLQLDQTAIKTQIPVDSVQALAPMLTQLGKFVLPLQQPAQNVFTQDFAILTSHPIPTPPPGSESFEDIQKEQSQLSKKIVEDTTVDPNALKELADVLAVLRALLVPPMDACNPKSDWSLAQAKFSNVAPGLRAVHDTIKELAGAPGTGEGGSGDKMAQDVTALAKIQAHINLFASAMSAAQKKSDEEIAELKTSNATLQKKIDDEEKKPRPNTQLIQDWKDQVQKNDIETKKKVANQAAADWQVQLDQLRAAQGVLGDMLSKAQSIVKTVFFPAETKLEALGATIGKSPASRSSFPIDDLLGNDKNDQQEVFTLNAVNYLTDSVKIFISSPAADPYSQALIKSTSTIGSGASLDMASGWSWARSCGHQPVLWRCEMTEPRFRRFADKVVNSISRRTRIDRYKARDARTPLPLERGSAALSPSPTYNSAALDLVVRKVMAPWPRWFLDLGQICPP